MAVFRAVLLLATIGGSGVWAGRAVEKSQTLNTEADKECATNKSKVDDNTTITHQTKACSMSDFTEVTAGDIVEKWKALLPHESAHLKVYKSPRLTANWNNIGAQHPPGTPSGTTFASAIGLIHASGLVVAHGGAIRDLLHDIQPKDIDLVWTSDTAALMESMKAAGFEIGKFSLEFEYLVFGQVEEGNDFEPLEGNGFNGAHRGTPCEAENDVNSLMYDPFDEVIIDPDGHGVADGCGHLFRLPEACNDVAEWLKNGDKTALRYFKMIEKSYTDANAIKDIGMVIAALRLQLKTSKPRLQAAYQTFMNQMGKATNSQRYL
jgi:hypothetical protein